MFLTCAAVLASSAASVAVAATVPVAVTLPAQTDSGRVEHSDLDRTTSLRVAWKVHGGDDLDWARADFDDSKWREVRIPGDDRGAFEANMAWLRLTIQVGKPGRGPTAEERADMRLGLTLGKIDSAYQVFAGGRLLGGVGSLPPISAVDYDRHAIYSIPHQAVAADGTLVIALRVFKSAQTRGMIGGPFEGPFLLGRLERLTRRELMSELPSLFLSGLFLVVSLFHLELFRRRPQLTGYLWFFACTTAFAVYTFLRTQWKYLLNAPFLSLKEFEHLFLLLLVAFFVQLVCPLLGLRIGPILRSYQWLCVSLGVLVAVTPGVALNLTVLPVWQLSVVTLVVYGVGTVLREAWRKNPEARIVAVGTIGSAVAALNEIAVARGFYAGPKFLSFGFAFFIVSLAASLANQFMRTHAELEGLRGELEKRVQDRTRKLLAASQSKTRFLATMSHEIRTPLNGVIGMSDLLLDTDLNPQQREFAEIARNSGDAVLALIDDILSFAKIEAGKVDLESKPFRLRDCIEGALDLLAARAAEKGLDLAYAVDRGVPIVVAGDAMRLRQILVNLLGNAVKFSDSGGVKLAVEKSNGERNSDDQIELHFRVVDTGIGVSEHNHDQLFKVFSQVDDSHARRFGGSGLGLAISHRLCELMGGRMWVESEPARGSTFHFTLRVEAQPATVDTYLGSWRPDLQGKRVLIVEEGRFTPQVLADHLEAWGMRPWAVDSPAEAHEAVRGSGPFHLAILGSGTTGSEARSLRGELSSQGVRSVVLRRINQVEQAEVSGEKVVRLTAPVKPSELYAALVAALWPKDPTPQRPVPPPALSKDVELPPISILLAEDDEVNRKVTLHMLDRLGCPADSVSNGLEVLEALGERLYDVVLLDVQMPELDGLEAARRIRTRWPRPGGPWLIATTANAIRGDRENCLAAGMDDYVSKPLKRSDLRAALERFQETAAVLDRTYDNAPALPPPAAPEEPNSLILDPAVLEGLRQLDDGEGEILQETIGIFLETTPARLKGLRTALEAQETGTIERLAHTLKSSSGILGGRRMMAVCARLEGDSRRCSIAEASSLISSLEEHFGDLRSKLVKEVAAD